MSKADYETHVLRIGRRHGKRYADRRPLVVPWNLATGNYEKLSALQLREVMTDLQAEADRRGGVEPEPPATNYDPLASQIRRPA